MKNMKIEENLCKLNIGPEHLERVGHDCDDKFIKFVGIKLDEYLDWNIHISHVCNKVSNGNFALNQCKNILPVDVRKLIYNSLVKSHIEYGILAWGKSSDGKINTLKTLQKKCIRTVSNMKRMSHTDPICGSLKILKFDDLFDLNAKSFMFKYNKRFLPESFNDMFIPLAEPNRTNSYRLELFKFKLLKSFPNVYLPKIWNSMPHDVKNLSKFTTFKNTVKLEIINQYNLFYCNNTNCSSCAT